MARQAKGRLSPSSALVTNAMASFQNTGEELLSAAIDAAKNRRRHLGLQ